MKTCFVISPIGEERSDTRKEADRVFNYIIKPATRRFRELAVKRADHIALPGSITNQVIKMICDSEIVIAELTGWNPNVMYELAIRHVVNKPTILILSSKETRLPFDLLNERTVRYDTTDLEAGTKSADALEAHIEYCLGATDDTLWSPSYLSDIMKTGIGADLHKNLSPELSTIAKQMEQAFVKQMEQVLEHTRASFDQQLVRLRDAMDGRVKTLNDALGARVMDIAKTLAGGGKEVVGALDKRIADVTTVINESLNASIDSTVATFGDKAAELEQKLNRFAEVLDQSLLGAAERAREIARLTADATTMGAEAIAQTYERLRTGEDQRKRTVNVHAQTSDSRKT
jgi:hypothetical protein